MKNKFALLLLVLTIFLNGSYAQEYKGKVVGILDGDTFTHLTSHEQQIKIRFAQIDTPERAQPFGTVARQALSDLIFSKEVRVVEADSRHRSLWLACRPCLCR